jgi:adenine-specific DNA-methyltransferase
VNYIGSKYSLLEFLEQTIDSVVGVSSEERVFADLFAGTGVVGNLFKRKGYYVIANDIQYYSYVLNYHHIINTPPLSSRYSQWLNSLNGIDGFLYNNYCAGSGSGRNYFTDENGRKCDAIRSSLLTLLAERKISVNEYYYYLAGLLNSIDAVANTASVYGAYLKHIKPSAMKGFDLRYAVRQIYSTNCV